MQGASGFCPKHLALTRRLYDEEQRPADLHHFYCSRQWQELRDMKLARNPVCEDCQRELAAHVHHVQPVREHPELALALDNLKSLCARCHNRTTAKETGRNRHGTWRKKQIRA